jgi:hypothetical protein
MHLQPKQMVILSKPILIFLWMQIVSLGQLRNNALIFIPIKSSKKHLLESKQWKKGWRIPIKVYFNFWEMIIYVLQEVKYLFQFFKKIAEEPYDFIFFHIVYWHLPFFGILYIRGKSMWMKILCKVSIFFIWEESEKNWLFLSFYKNINYKM